MSENHILRPMTRDDLERVLLWRNHPEIRRYMYTQHEISLSEHTCWYDRVHQDSERHLLIYEKQGLPMGFVQIHQIGAGGIADWGFYIAPEASKGSGRELGAAALSYAFTSKKLHKLCGQALCYNENSIKFHEKLGFQQEGILRDQHFDGQHYHDVVCFGVLASQWQPKIKR